MALNNTSPGATVMDIRLGIVGAGQLGLYLCEAARALGVRTTVLAEQASDPASHRADHLIIGAADDPETIAAFIDHCDLVTFEKEAIAEPLLLALTEAEARGDVIVRPGIATLAMLKDKGLQKQWLEQQGFPTLPYTLLDGDVAAGIEQAKAIGLPVVQKSRRGGYDGRGVQVLHDLDSLQDLWDSPSLLEPCLESHREFAILCARSADGEMASYPPVELCFDPELNVLTHVITLEAGSDLDQRARTLGEEVVSAMGGVGIFAIELFMSDSGELLINEISPRVHNSGHLTMEAAGVSQFEQHVRAVVGLPLDGNTQLKPAAMVNILATRELGANCNQPLKVQYKESAVIVHWYGKPSNREGRKIGHITALAESPEHAAAMAEQALTQLDGSEAA